MTSVLAKLLQNVQQEIRAWNEPGEKMRGAATSPLHTGSFLGRGSGTSGQELPRLTGWEMKWAWCGSDEAQLERQHSRIKNAGSIWIVVKRFWGQVGPGTLGQEKAKRLASIIKPSSNPGQSQVLNSLLRSTEQTKCPIKNSRRTFWRVRNRNPGGSGFGPGGISESPGLEAFSFEHAGGLKATETLNLHL